ncbi:MAG TPA: DUF6101 family protein [Mesorhizobium sp.]|jgi:hypothetical protein|nr:DUF6101 family protein [Mesorhizobium sp.]
MHNTGTAQPIWAGRDMRLDPLRLPHAMSFADRDAFGEVVFTIDARGARIRRRLQQSGLPVTVALPPRAFKGVAARAIDDGIGNVTVTLELMHADPMLSVPLLVARDLEDVAADWRGWSDAFRLPMLLVESDGVARTLEESLSAAPRACDRRQGRPTRERRPRFLMRRKMGTLGLRLTIEGQEIIAPDHGSE